jgi:hypothetical protein
VYASGPVTGASQTKSLIDGNATISSGIQADSVASSTLCQADEDMGKSGSRNDFAQSFVAGSSTPLSKVRLMFKRTGSPNKDPIVSIVTDNSGSPATTALASQSFSVSVISTSYTEVEAVFSSPASLVVGLTYWIVVDSNDGTNGSKYFTWCRSAADNYAVGSAKYKDDWTTAGSWTAITGDLAFKLYYGLGESQLASLRVTGAAKADTLSDVKIDGDAYFQSTSSVTILGVSYPSSPTPPQVPMPISSTTIAQWKNDAQAGSIITGNYNASNTTSLGPVKITGNLTMDPGTDLTITGTIYVLGTVDLENLANVHCAFDYGTRSCIIMSDSSIEVSPNVTLGGSGVSGSFLMLLSTKTGCLGSGGTGCATGDSAIHVANNSNGAIYYSTDSAIDIHNNVTVTAVVGYFLHLNNGAKVVYDPAIAQIVFAPNATSSVSLWNVDRWREGI